MSIFESFNACKIFARGESESHRGDQGLALQVHHLLSQGLLYHDIDDDDDDDDVQVHNLLCLGLVDDDSDEDDDGEDDDDFQVHQPLTLGQVGGIW